MIINLCIIAVTFGLLYAGVCYSRTKKLATVGVSTPLESLAESINDTKAKMLEKETIQKLLEISASIRDGAVTFLKLEFKAIIKVSCIILALLFAFISIPAGIACLIGIIMTSIPSWIGMRAATYANVATTDSARKTKKIAKALKVAFQGGNVMGNLVSACVIIGFVINYLLFFNLGVDKITNWLGFSYSPYSMVITAYSCGCSLIAMFARIGGGIYTKAADSAADLVGKTEYKIDEDDARNPASMCDAVGDNVGDVFGNGCDLQESTAGAIVSSMLIGILLSSSATVEQLKALTLFPLGVAACGLIASVIGSVVVLNLKGSDNPHKDLDRSTTISAILTCIFTLVLSFLTFKDMDCSIFRFGWFSPALSTFIGSACGILVGLITEYFTSTDYNPTRRIANAAKDSVAFEILEGIAVAAKTPLCMMILVGIALFVSYFSSGIYGISVAGTGMLAFVANTISVDTYGPISDNAGGIAEMARLDKNVRRITDKLDSVGNTTAAIGKGFAICSATYAALGLMLNYTGSYKEDMSLNITSIEPLVGSLVGAMLPLFFAGILIMSVRKTANAMVIEVKRQFKEVPGILEYTEKPDYNKCIEIAAKMSLQEMKKSAIIAVIVPVVCGFIFGPDFVAGLLFGGIITAILIAIVAGNIGGAWDNAKKYIEAGEIEGEGKGSLAHIAAVICDIIGDSLKDTVGPCMDIFIKIMNTVSLLTSPIYSTFNLLMLFA